MSVRELIERLKQLPPDAKVRLTIQTEAGYYDVRAQYASGGLKRVAYNEFRQYVELEG